METSCKVSEPSETGIFQHLLQRSAVGIVGGQNIDLGAGKLEKLAGEPRLQGKGIANRATFGFLYYAFMILNLNKVYIHSRDINARNINLNSRFGFELEGVFLDDISVGDKYQHIVSMALFKPRWLQIFSREAYNGRTGREAELNAVSNASSYEKFFSRSHDAVIHLYDKAGNVIETHEHSRDLKQW
jgi:hypothetical protein